MTFDAISRRITYLLGHSAASLSAVGIVILWALLGPVAHFSNTWQLVINTGTTVVTFLMVFVLQHTQNRDSLAMHVKLDELLRAVEGAKNAVRGVESKTQEELQGMSS